MVSTGNSSLTLITRLPPSQLAGSRTSAFPWGTGAAPARWPGPALWLGFCSFQRAVSRALIIMVPTLSHFGSFCFYCFILDKKIHRLFWETILRTIYLFSKYLLNFPPSQAPFCLLRIGQFCPFRAFVWSGRHPADVTQCQMIGNAVKESAAEERDREKWEGKGLWLFRLSHPVFLSRWHLTKTRVS